MIARYKKLLISLVLLTASLSGGCERTIYPINKDTERTFGDGRFQIGVCWHRDSEDSKMRRCYGLFDAKTNQCVASEVLDWTTKGDFLFTVDRKGGCRITDYRTGAGKDYKTIEDVPLGLRPIFQKLQ